MRRPITVNVICDFCTNNYAILYCTFGCGLPLWEAWFTKSGRGTLNFFFFFFFFFSVPGRRGRFLEAATNYDIKEGQALLCEPDSSALGEKGLSSQESLFTVNSKGTLLVPLQNLVRQCTDGEERTQLGRVEIFDKSILEQAMESKSTCEQVSTVLAASSPVEARVSTTT